MLSYCVFGILLSLDILAVTHAAGDWTYKPGPYGPSNWKDVDANCGKKSQSPIDIKGAKYDEAVKDPVFTEKYNQVLTGTKFTLIHSGYTVKVEISVSSGHTEQSVTMFGKTWIPAQFHWHWGPDDTKGSEHTVDRKMYPLEVHLIHVNSDYFAKGLGEALKHSDGLLVMGTFYEIGSPNDGVITDVEAAFSSVKYSGDNKTISPFKYNKLMPSSKDFYHYNGSLTTPDCQEVVSWVVYKNTLKVTSAAMAKFRQLYIEKRGANTTTPVTMNYRPVQGLNGRKIVTNFKISGAGQSLPTSLFYYILPAFLYVLVK